MKNTKTVIAVVAMVVIAGGSFFGGMKYGQTKKPNGMPGGFPGSAMGANRNSQGNGGMISGEITAKDDKSITVKTQDGSMKIVYFSDSTSINKSSDGATSDLSQNQQVTISGTSNSDGSTTAKNIQIRPVTTK